MALQLNKTTKEGITVTDAYCKVGSISNLDKTVMIVNVNYSGDKDSKPFTVERVSIAYDMTGDNPIKQAYDHLKTLPEFADAVDV
jgi:hypothetical protein